MTQARRQWIATFADPAVLSDLFAAARDVMRQICEHDPEDCGCELNRFTPQEFAEWIQIECERERGKPMHLRPAGQPNRKRDGDLRLNLAAAS